MECNLSNAFFCFSFFGWVAGGVYFFVDGEVGVYVFCHSVPDVYLLFFVVYFELCRCVYGFNDGGCDSVCSLVGVFAVLGGYRFGFDGWFFPGFGLDGYFCCVSHFRSFVLSILWWCVVGAWLRLAGLHVGTVQ